ncbi:MAG: DUF4956 domain-containing protein [Bacilli bacterium]|nr:DUF4956 domain-containing protein [Bacilli bacterium]
MDSLFTLLTDVNQIVVCLIIFGITLVISFLFTFAVSFKARVTKSFLVTSVVMPALVSAIISMVAIFLDSKTESGAMRIATIAVALGLIRFRSVNGRAEEMLLLFAGVGFGLIAGLGYVTYAAIVAFVVAALYLFFTNVKIFEGKRFEGEKLLKVTIPETLEYDEMFNETFDHYLKSAELVQVKTTGMGSLFRLSYRIEFKNIKEQKEFIDELRTKNGNLEISILPFTGNDKSL